MERSTLFIDMALFVKTRKGAKLSVSVKMCNQTPYIHIDYFKLRIENQSTAVNGRVVFV